MAIETQNQLLTPKDRLALRVERVQDLLNKKEIPDPFNAYVFIDHETEQLLSTATTETGAQLGGPIKCRIYNETIHAGLPSPLDAGSAQEFQASINSCSEGIIRADHIDAPKLVNGSIWNCTVRGQHIQVLSLVQTSSFNFDASTGRVMGKVGGAMSAFGREIKKPVLTVLREEGGKITLLVPSKKLQDQLDKYSHFRDFFEKFIERLEKTAYTGTTIQVNSLFRDGPAQARAMLGGRFDGSAASLQVLRKWFLNTYDKNLRNNKEPYNIIFGTEWRSYAALEKALGDQYTKQINDGWHKDGTGHSTLKAIDIKTSDQPYDNVIIMLDVLKGMKSEGIVKGYNWEEVWDHVKGKPEVGLKIRRERGVFSGTEHIHLSVTAEPEGEVHEES